MEIKSAAFIISMSSYQQRSPICFPQLAVVGKSNVGKSSLINTLCNRKKLCKTSSTPGKTRLINVFMINDRFHIVDLPGYGFAKVDKKEKRRWVEMMEQYFRESTLLCHVLHLVDIRHEPTQDDIDMGRFLREMGIAFTVIATKTDKVSRGARMKHVASICRALLVQPWEIVLFSSDDGTGRKELLQRLHDIYYLQDSTENLSNLEEYDTISFTR